MQAGQPDVSQDSTPTKSKMKITDELLESLDFTGKYNIVAMFPPCLFNPKVKEALSKIMNYYEIDFWTGIDNSLKKVESRIQAPHEVNFFHVIGIPNANNVKKVPGVAFAFAGFNNEAIDHAASNFLRLHDTVPSQHKTKIGQIDSKESYIKNIKNLMSQNYTTIKKSSLEDLPAAHKLDLPNINYDMNDMNNGFVGEIIKLKSTLMKQKKQVAKRIMARIQKSGQTVEQPASKKNESRAHKIVTPVKPVVQKLKPSLTVFVPIGIPGMGKSHFFAQLEKKFRQQGNCSVATISSDKMRREAMDQLRKDRPHTTIEQAFNSTSKSATQGFMKALETQLRCAGTESFNHAIFVDKNHPPNAIEKTINLCRKFASQGRRLKIVAMVPKCESKLAGFPFSMSFFFQCMQRCRHRSDHETLPNDNPRKLLQVLFMFAKMFENEHFDSDFRTRFGLDSIWEVPYTFEHEAIKVFPNVEELSVLLLKNIAMGKLPETHYQLALVDEINIALDLYEEFFLLRPKPSVTGSSLNEACHAFIESDDKNQPNSLTDPRYEEKESARKQEESKASAAQNKDRGWTDSFYDDDEEEGEEEEAEDESDDEDVPSSSVPKESSGAVFSNDVASSFEQKKSYPSKTPLYLASFLESALDITQRMSRIIKDVCFGLNDVQDENVSHLRKGLKGQDLPYPYKWAKSFHVTTLFIGNNERQLNHPIFKNYMKTKGEAQKSEKIFLNAVVIVPKKLVCAICFPRFAVDNTWPHVTLLTGTWKPKHSNDVLKQLFEDNLGQRSKSDLDNFI